MAKKITLKNSNGKAFEGLVIAITSTALIVRPKKDALVEAELTTKDLLSFSTGDEVSFAETGELTSHKAVEKMVVRKSVTPTNTRGSGSMRMPANC